MKKHMQDVGIAIEDLIVSLESLASALKAAGTPKPDPRPDVHTVYVLCRTVNGEKEYVRESSALDGPVVVRQIKNATLYTGIALATEKKAWANKGLEGSRWWNVVEKSRLEEEDDD